MDSDEYQQRTAPDKRRMKKKKKQQRHQLARMTVDVYRLFKIRDAATALRLSENSVASHLADQICNEATYMLKPYIERQSRLAAKPDPDFLKALTSLKQLKPRRKSNLRRRIKLG